MIFFGAILLKINNLGINSIVKNNNQGLSIYGRSFV